MAQAQQSGSYTIKLASNSNVHPIIAVAGKGSHYVETLIDRSKGDTIIDYREGPEATIQGIHNTLQKCRLLSCPPCA